MGVAVVAERRSNTGLNLQVQEPEEADWGKEVAAALELQEREVADWDEEVAAALEKAD